MTNLKPRKKPRKSTVEPEGKVPFAIPAGRFYSLRKDSTGLWSVASVDMREGRWHYNPRVTPPDTRVLAFMKLVSIFMLKETIWEKRNTSRLL